MPEKIKIAELSIDPKKLLNELEQTKKSIDELTQTQKALKAAGDTSSQTFIQNEADLKKLRKEYNGQIKTLQAVSGGVDALQKELNKEVNSIREAKDQNQALRRIRDEINTETEDGQKLLKQLNDRIDQNTNLTKENTDAITKQKNNVGNYTASINKAKIGVRAFGSALKAAGIGLAVAAFAALTNALSKNRRVMLVVQTAMNAVSSVLQPLISSIVDGVKAAYDATGGFDAMGKVISSLITLALTPLKTAFYTIKSAFLGAQLIWEKSIFGSGDQSTINQLTDNLKNTRNEIAEIGKDAANAGKTLYNSMGEAASEVASTFSNLGDSVGKTFDKLGEKGLSGIVGDAAAVARFEQQLDRLDAKQEEIALKYQKRAELLRQQRDDETLTVAQRTAANEQLNQLLQEQAAAEKAIVNEKIAGYQQMLEINKDDIEAQQNLAEARNQILEVEERITGQMSESLTNRNSLRNDEIKAEQEKNKQITDNELAAQQERQNRLDELKKQFADKEKEEIEIKTEASIEKRYADLEKEIENITEDEGLKRELLKNLEIQKNDELTEIRNAEAEKEKNRRQAEIDAIVQAEKDKLNAKKQTVDQIASLFGQETAVAKAALIAKQALAIKEWGIDNAMMQSKQTQAVAESTANNAKGLSETAASAPFPWNIPLIAGYVAQTVGIVSSIKNAFKKKKQPTFAKGGLLKGASHAAGGIQTPFGELEGNEAVINKRSTRMFAPLLSAINVAGGGRKFASGGMLDNSSIVTGQLINYDLLASKVAEANLSLPAPQVSVEEINSTQTRVSTIENRASF
ncbi:coiled-coil domain-containing protein [Zunongwangia atlantica]|uniref:Chromosome segregation ATPase n=1 Tax=Zunongwangia atlantica 22II14-10F7 TaxID=1185767 RepID=A0A1Y1T4K9_9FLAO|nr:hypothetical protein [Zunongwangia atlantica]ORL45383.1 chromosome segregation ATPase [Zunongwangia atlantica 22II14-10F7]